MTTKSVIVGLDGRPIVNAVQSTYEGAGQGRRMANIFAPGSGPNAALINALPTLRNRSRAGYRNNPWIKHGTNRLTSNEIGTGIVPRSRSKNDALRQAINALWNITSSEIDADGVLDIYGMQTLSSRTRNMAGEIFIRRRSRRMEDGYAVPMQLQALEPEFCPDFLNSTNPKNGNRIKAGIEFDGRGRRVAYWMYRSHPNDIQYDANIADLVRVPASDVIHHYIPLRPGQLRGEPVTAQALLKAFTFDSYDDAELKRKETKSSITGFLKKTYDGEEDWMYDPMTGELLDTDSDGVNNISIQAGTLLSGLPGEEPIMFDGDNTGSGYADFMRQQLMGIATGLEGIPYEILSGDWSKVNDRLVRAVLHEFRRGIEAVQDQYMIHQLCRQVWEWFIDAAVLGGALRVSNYQVNRRDAMTHEWRPQGWPYLQPQTDIAAKKDAISSGLSSLEAEVAKTGYDYDTIQDQNIEAEKRMVEKRRAAGLPDYPPSWGVVATADAASQVSSDEDDEAASGGGGALDPRDTIDAYGIGVRAGVITPQPDDEVVFRNAANLPGMTDEVRALWREQGGYRQPVTLKEHGAGTDKAQTNDEPA